MLEKANKVMLDDYVWFTPKPKVPQAAITIPNPSGLNLNKYALLELPTKFVIGAALNGEMLCLKEDPEKGYSATKSGSIKAKEIVAFLMENGVELPARYVIHKEDNCWTAELVQKDALKINLEKSPRKISKNAKHSIEEELK